MSNYVWREASAYTYTMDGYYAKNLSLAWINWEMNMQEERVRKSTKYDRQSTIEKQGHRTRTS
jgi:hypothetical protein